MAIETLYTAVSTLALPVFRTLALANPKLRDNLEERFLGGSWKDFSFPEGSLWYHGASVGEIGGLAPIVNELAAAYPDIPTVMTTSTMTAQVEIERRNLPGSRALFPYDHPRYVAKAVEVLRPRAYVLAETELWPALLFELRRRQVPVVMVNARISDYSFPRYRRLKFFTRPLLRGMESILVQTELDRERFFELGASEAQIQVTGSTKYDVAPVHDVDEVRRKLFHEFGLSPEAPCLVAGSVRPYEAKVLLEAFRRVQKDIPELQLIVAPRHPEKFEETAEIIGSAGCPFFRRSQGVSTEKNRVVLLDSMGELREVYSLGTLAFIGATLVDIGGHNPLEPAAYGVPPVMGPHVGNVKDAVGQLRAESSLLMVESEEELSRLLLRVLQDKSELLRLSAAARKVAQANMGATKRILDILLPIVERSGAGERRYAVCSN